MTDPRQDFGRAAEELAAEYLRKKGYRLLEKNHRTKLGEIDLIMEDGETIVFVEVKAGSASKDFPPYGHLNPQKVRKLLTLGKAYLARLRKERNARFDLVTVVREGDNFRIDHLEDVIQDALG
jgi:putative endonuclease